jgi:hypothetical protein
MLRCVGAAGELAMNTIPWLELGAGVLLVAFIAFAFRQGMKVRPLDPDERPPPFDRNAAF